MCCLSIGGMSRGMIETAGVACMSLLQCLALVLGRLSLAE